MNVDTLTKIIATIPDPRRLCMKLDRYDVMEISKSIFLSLIMEFYDVLVTAEKNVSAEYPCGMIFAFRVTAAAILNKITDHELYKLYHCRPEHIFRVRKEIGYLIQNCDIYSI